MLIKLKYYYSGFWIILLLSKVITFKNILAEIKCNLRYADVKQYLIILSIKYFINLKWITI